VEGIGLPQYRKKFMHHCIGGQLLLRLTDELLKKELGIGPLVSSDLDHSWHLQQRHACAWVVLHGIAGNRTQPPMCFASDLAGCWGVEEQKIDQQQHLRVRVCKGPFDMAVVGRNGRKQQQMSC
jgi:hypothetical protein